MEPIEQIIRPKRGLSFINFKELWIYKELFLFLTWRDIIVRYKQTVIGIAWAVIRPILTMVVFSIIFGKIAKLPSNGIPYPILTFTALLPWQFFANTLSESSNSLISNANLISKIYFPRLIMPVAAVLSGVVEFLISFLILIVMIIYYKMPLTFNIIYLPLFFIFAFVTSLGIGLWFSALNVEYRDVRYVIPFLIQIGLYISPVGFSSTIIPDYWKLLYSLNPMVGVIDGFRWSLLGHNISLYMPGLYLSILISILILITGSIYFRKMERTFADII